MASGKTHLNINIFVLILCVLISLFVLDARLVVIWFVSAAFGSVFFSPDLDLSQSKSTQAWGRLRFLWIGYSRYFQHRKISHFPIIGTLTRILYFAMVILIFSILVRVLLAFYRSDTFSWDSLEEGALYSIFLMYELFTNNEQIVLCVFLGLSSADFLHVVTDVMYSFMKKMGGVLLRVAGEKVLLNVDKGYLGFITVPQIRTVFDCLLYAKVQIVHQKDFL